MTMLSKEQKDLLLLYQCIIDTGAEVLREFTKPRLKLGFKDFTEMLEKKKHYFFHQNNNKRMHCCECPSTGCIIPFNGDLDKSLFDKMYVLDSTITIPKGHQTNNGTVQQKCLCRFQVTTISINDLDLSNLNYLIKKLKLMYSHESNLKDALKNIMKIRGNVMHAVSSQCYSLYDLVNLWNDFEAAILQFAPPNSNFLLTKLIAKAKKELLSEEDIKSLMTMALEDHEKAEDDKSTLIHTIEEKVSVIERNTTTVVGAAAENINTHVSQEIQPVKDKMERLECIMAVVYHQLVKLSVSQQQLPMVRGERGADEGNEHDQQQINATARMTSKSLTEQAEDTVLERLPIEIKDYSPTDMDEIEQSFIQHNNDRFGILSKRKNCIILELIASPRIFTSKERLRSAILRLVREVLLAGNVDTSIEDSIYLKLDFDTPLTRCQYDVVSELMSTPYIDKVEPDKTRSVQNQTEYSDVDTCKLCIVNSEEITRLGRQNVEQKQQIEQQKDNIEQQKQQIEQQKQQIKQQSQQTEEQTQQIDQQRKKVMLNRFSVWEDAHQGMENSGSSSDDIGREFDVPEKTEHKYWKTKLQLIEEIKRSVGTVGPGKQNLNVVVIGTSGCGKRSFINTALTSFREDKWQLYSYVGQNSGNITNITQRFKSFRADKTYYREKPKFLLPTFIDINGLENNTDGFNRAFLRALFDGKIKEDEQLTTLKELYKNPSKFKKMMASRPQYLKVNRIVVVASSDPNEPLATELFKCIKEVADDVKGISIFGVMTKKDKFRTNQQVPKRKDDFLGNLGITDNSFKLVQNYCPDIDRYLRYQRTVYPQIDVPVLSFINQVVNPHLSRDYTNYVPSACGRLIVKIVACFCRFIQILIWLFLLAVFTQIYFDDDNDKHFCTTYDKLSKTHEFTLPNVDFYCKGDKYAAFYFFSIPIAVSLLLFVIPPLVRRILRVGTSTVMCISLIIICTVCTSIYYYHGFVMKLNMSGK